MSTLIAVLGAVVYRARGSGLWPGRPWWQLAFAFGYGIVAMLAGGPICAAIVWGVTTAAVLTGHAAYLDLGAANGTSSAPADGGTDEWYGKWIPGVGYWHDFAGLAVSGLLITVSAGVASAIHGELLSGALIGLSGLLKAPAYALAKFAPDRIDQVALGEGLTGAMLWGALAAIATS